ncbi:MAG: site-specific integrase [Bacteroidota bacterium]
MELSFKIVQDKRHQKLNETYPLKLRVYQNRTYKECTLNINVPIKDWDINLQTVLSSNPNYSVLNSKLASTKAKVQKLIILNEDLEDLPTPEEIIKLLKNKQQKKMPNSKACIIQYGKEHIEKLKVSGRIGSAITYSCGINKLKEYAKTEKLTFEEVDYKFIENFNTALLKEGIKINSIGNYFRSIRALFNKAIKENVVEAKYYPFKSFKIKTERTISRALTSSEISSILGLEVEIGSSAWHHRNLFALSYCFIGINFSDLLTLTKQNFVDDRIIFRRSKTHKIYNIKIQPKAKEILHCYFNELPIDNREFVLPFIKNKNNPETLKKEILQKISLTNDYLKKIAELCGINKNVTTYYARYTWANIAREQGYPKDMIAEALGHEYGNKMTGIYLDNYNNEIIDKMNEKVICSVF